MHYNARLSQAPDCVRVITYSCDTTSAHCEFDWLIYVLDNDKGSLDMGVAGDGQVIHRTFVPIIVLIRLAPT